MARPRARKKVKNPALKVTRRVNQRRKRVAIKSDPLVAAVWDRKLTLRQNYTRIGLATVTHFATGGVEPERKPLLDPTEHGMQEEQQCQSERLLSDEGSGEKGMEVEESEQDNELLTTYDRKDDNATRGSAAAKRKKRLKGEAKKKCKRKLNPDQIPVGMGFIERDDKGKVVNVVIGTMEETDPRDVTELTHVPAKTKLVEYFEMLAANALKKERHQSVEEQTWIQNLIAKHGDNYERMFRDKKLNVYQQTVSQLRRRVEKYLDSGRLEMK